MVKFAFVIGELRSITYDTYNAMCLDLEKIIDMFPEQIISVEILKVRIVEG